MGITSLFRMIMALRGERSRGRSEFFSQIWIERWSRNEAAVHKVNPRGLKKLTSHIKLHSLFAGEGTQNWCCGSAVKSFCCFTCCLRHWPRRVSPLNEWQLRHNIHQRWHMMLFPFQLGYPEIQKRKKTLRLKSSLWRVALNVFSINIYFQNKT